jgi:hypothetical protein
MPTIEEEEEEIYRERLESAKKYQSSEAQRASVLH